MIEREREIELKKEEQQNFGTNFVHAKSQELSILANNKTIFFFLFLLLYKH